MKPLRNRLLEARSRSGMPWEVLERDYLLSWVLAGLGAVDSLRGSLAFKGGTALEKCYFGEYRFSEDLDFSTLGPVPTGDAMEAAIGEVCQAAASLLDEYAPVTFGCERYAEREPHPGGQEAFTIRAQLPWHRTPQSRIMVEITVDEPVLKPVAERPVSHEYGEPLDARVRVYALEEIVAEKLRSILQHLAALYVRGWGRSRARDYYDLWRILGESRSRLDFSGFPTFLADKCAVRDVTFNEPDDFFPAAMLTDVEKTWSRSLGPLVPELPEFRTVMDELRPRIFAILS